MQHEGAMPSLFSFSGRIGRAAYWVRTIPTMLVIIASGFLTIHPSSAVRYPALIVFLIAIEISFATVTKRWHDRGKGGEWVLVSFVPIIGGFWTLVECGFLPGDPHVNQYGQPQV